jgi:hypothetical protein
MTLPLPFVIGDRDDIQSNFDELSTSWLDQQTLTTVANTNARRGVFSANRAAALSLTSPAVVPFDTETYDPSGWFDVTTNIGRYTPLVAGYYRFSWMVGAATPVAPGWTLANLLKNGAIHKRGPLMTDPSGALGAYSAGSSNAQANGTTDFFEVQFFTSAAGARVINVGADFCYFSGELIAPS